MSESRILRSRVSGSIDVADRAVAPPPSGTDKFLGTVVAPGSGVSLLVDHFVSVYQTSIDGPEVEGGAVAFNADTSVKIPGIVIGQAPVAGDRLVFSSIGGRWIARKRGSSGVVRPPWSCIAAAETLTLTWYYYTCEIVDPLGFGFAQFGVSGPIVTTLNNTHGTSIFPFKSAAEALPDDAHASCTPLVGGDTDAERCRYVRFTAGCTDGAITNPGAGVLINSLDGGGLSPPGGPGDCDIAGLGQLLGAVVTSGPSSVTYTGANTVFPLFAHGILTL